MTNDDEAVAFAAADNALKCLICDAESEWVDGFVAAGKNKKKQEHVCLTCAVYQQKYTGFWTTGFLWGLGLTVFGAFLFESILLGVLFAVTAYVFSYLAIIVHELGHVLAAYSVGIPVPAISFGGGLRARILRLGKTFLILSPSATEGLTVLAYTTRENYRKKTLWILAAGPLVNLLFAVSGFVFLVMYGDNLSKIVGVALTFWLVINGLLGIGNLSSFTITTPFGTQQSDGAQIWGLRTITDDEIDEVIQQKNVTLGMLEFHFGDPERVLGIVEDMIDQGDDTPHARNLITATLAETGHLERGIAIARSYLARSDLELADKTILQNNLAYMLLQTGALADLNEANHLSSIVMKTMPMMMAARGTRGAVLIATGRHEEGVAMLTDQRFKLETLNHQSIVKSNLARGQALLGRKEEAFDSLAEARALDPNNRQLAAAEAAVAALTG